jgi:hypothetical protein
MLSKVMSQALWTSREESMKALLSDQEAQNYIMSNLVLLARYEESMADTCCVVCFERRDSLFEWQESVYNAHNGRASEGRDASRRVLF